MREFDPISVIESAYNLDLDDSEWMAGILREVRPELDDGFGVGMFEVRLDSTGRPDVGTMHFDSDTPDIFRKIVLEMNAAVGDEEIESVYEKRFVHATASERVAHIRQDFRADPIYRKYAQPHGVYDFIGLQITDPTGTLLNIGAPTGEVRSTTAEARRCWSRIAAHIAAAYRLRNRAGELGPDRDDVEAVLNTDGRVEHIADSGAREQLEHGARRRSRARGGLRTSSPDEAVELWQALVDGRYTLVDHVDTDGRHLILARQNSPDVDEPQGLSPRERQVVHFAALGHPNQLIAYELGIAISTVSTLLGRGLGKLNLESRHELARVWGATHRETPDA